MRAWGLDYRFERRVPGRLQCRLRDRKVVADLGVELAGDVGYVENIAQLLHRLVDSIFGHSSNRPERWVLAV